MKIDLSLAPVDKEPARASAHSDLDRGVMGDAFGKAVRDAEGKRSANANDQASRADAETAKPSEEGAGDTVATDQQDALETEGKDETKGKADPLQALLGALVGAKAPAGGKDATAEQGKAGREAPEIPDAAGLKVAVSEEAAAKDKAAVKLDVLRMETHFEPHQDGMVLVEGRAVAKPDAASAAEAKAGGAGNASVTAALADIAKGRTGEAKSAAANGPQAEADDGAAVPMRFDEAISRLGRNASESSGRETGRDGSAAAQSALGELAARRNAARSADAAAGTVSATTAMPSSSPYNLAGQVAGPIMEALGDPAQASTQSAPASSDAHLRMRAGGGALKTLTIQLHPEHLGTVDVSMRLNEGRLTLELAASRSDTASMLLDDQASLRKLLEHAGFSLDDAAISVITRDNGQLRTADASGTNSQPNDQGGRPAGEGRSDARGQSSGSDEQASRRRPTQQGRDDGSPAKSQAGSTYL
ncbi:flagellar hook-length control protein FliK [Aureimonas phyllosphaerae]|uniref:Flagellar hook-length control protein FliK n=1 Tax=Aureimonas phyllosphaerae TaxID=1166078 RepID=A0A7W6BZB8_9HYPH|nr:flagellar hook-length control protein FliK [Aureimonas phyllosphaerae]MBB3935562.1 flagellar hook-length control protein FliK [Aureimonas phyllosphaerae]MBB3959570.1 flagellar hook-length control protein FliK [Aureimonas phyllosphaerae]SFF12303.1 hook-length control protein FliK [Aureimonas phyllosphaerae]